MRAARRVLHGYKGLSLPEAEAKCDALLSFCPWPQPGHRRPKLWVMYLCEGCGQRRLGTPCGVVKRYMQNKGGAIYCTKTCSSHFNGSRDRFIQTRAARRKRPHGVSDEQWGWETRLCELGLEMGRGVGALQYGETEWR